MSKPVIKTELDENGLVKTIEVCGVIFAKQDKYDLKDFAENLLTYLRQWL